MKNLESFIEGLKRGSYIQLETLTEPKMRKTNNPYFGRVTKHTVLSGIRSGVSYENSVNNALNRQGEEATFESQKPFGRSWKVVNLILQSDKDPNQLYFRTSIDKSSRSKSEYLLDGKVVEDENTLNDIKSFIQGGTPSKKQTEAGLNDENQIIIRDFKFKSILSIKQGDTEIKNI